MMNLFKILSFSLIAAATMALLPLSQTNAVVKSDLGTHNPELFGIFGCCGCWDFCCDECEHDTCGPC